MTFLEVKLILYSLHFS